MLSLVTREDWNDSGFFLTTTTRKQHHPKEGEESSTTQKRGKWEPPLHLTSLDFTLLQFDLMTSCSLYLISFHFTHKKGDGSNTNKDRGTQKAKGPLLLDLNFYFCFDVYFTSLPDTPFAQMDSAPLFFQHCCECCFNLAVASQCFLARGSSRRRLSHRRCYP